jgi:hypothetical protein
MDDLNIINHDNLQKIVSHRSKFRELQHINWNNSFKTMMDFVEEYTEKWVQREEVELDILSE